jgi:hypothetical protein
MAADPPPSAGDPSPRVDPRERLGWIVTAVGLIVIVSSVLWVSSAGYGVRARHDFAERRSYNMVKRDVHEVLPRAIVQGLAGLGVVLLGARMRRRARAPRGEAPEPE